MLKIKNLGIVYQDNTNNLEPKERLVVKDINLEVSPGQVIVLTGKSGSGKSSLLKAINGIINDEEGVKIFGDIEFYRNSIIEKSIGDRSRFMSTVFQNPKSQFYCINTMDEMAFALENRNIPRDDIIETIEKYSNQMDTKSLLNRNIFQLSGGEKQLIAVTATVCMNNEVYLFDEPSASLDKNSIFLLEKIIEKLKAMGKIIIIAEHRLYYLKNIMTKLAILENGNLEVFSTEEKSLRNALEKYNLRTMEEIKIEDLDILDINRVNLLKNQTFNKDTYKKDTLICEEFKTSYGDKQILDLTLSFSPGINFIVGENGVGKTTFIKKLSGLLKGQGNRFYNSKKIKRSYEYISMVMQDVNYQIFTDSVWHEISIISDDELLKSKVLKEMDLYDKRELHPHILSGGEKQRLLIALAKVSNKPIIILDEPTSGLCKGKMLKIIEYLHEMAKEDKIVIVITHDLEFIKECGGRVYEFIREEL